MLGEVSIHLSEDFEVGNAGYEGEGEDSVINLVIVDTVKGDGLIVVRQLAYEGSCRRDDHFVLAGGSLAVEDAVLVEVVPL